ncbi:MAG TPA: succinate dehydrogenase [Terriglobales bacterium]|nr:succinate dehydrogenase [Terriglobales bacterium]
MADSPALVRLEKTQRRDAWWVELVPVWILLGGFGVYATWRAFEGDYYSWGPYLSPFYSPLIDAQHHWWHWSPAILILGGPLSFRATCYYYRKAYYRAFFFDPPACAVGEKPGNYRGETRFPFILQNLHRYALYLAFIFLCFLWYDAVRAFWFDGSFGIGTGTVIMLTNVILLTFYTFSCHSLRHLIGGKLDCFSCVAGGGARHSAWKLSSYLNESHMLFAWASLISVGATDFYIRLVASGAIRDLRLL